MTDEDRATLWSEIDAWLDSKPWLSPRLMIDTRRCATLLREVSRYQWKRRDGKYPA